MVKISDNGIITEEAMLAYVSNSLSAEERQELEKLLKEDPFAQDALEGLLAVENKSAVSNTVSSLNRKVRERTGVKERKGISFHWTNYAWAAVLIGLLIGVGFVMINFLGKNNNEMAVSTEAAKTDEQVLFDQKPNEPNLVSGNSESNHKDTLTTIQTQTDIPVDITLKNTSPKPALVEGVSPTTTSTFNPSSANTSAVAIGNGGAGKPKPSIQAEATIADKKADEKAAAYKKLNAEEQNKKTTRTKNEEVPVSKQAALAEERSAGMKADIAEKKSAITIDDAMKSFNSGDYNKSSEQFNQILKEQPDNNAALYFGGISDYINSDAKKGEKNFDKLLKKGDNYIEGSKWYKANILLKKGRKDEAKKLLDELAGSSGSYKERAVKKKAEAGL